MSNISKKTLSRVLGYNNTHSDEQTCKEFNITKGTLGRYRRKARMIGNSKLFDFPNILIFDVETAPMEIYVWGLYKQRPSHENVIMDWYLLSWSAKWLFSDEVMSDVLTPEEAIDGNDERICQSMWNLFETAHIVIAHNANRFDIRKLNARWMLNGLLPPSPYKTIDTLKESIKIAAHSSHKLDYLGQIIAKKGKLETDYDLWKRCKKGDPTALKYMEEYNREDVLLLEDVYLGMRPWINSHPNVSLYIDSDKPLCTACGSKKLHPVEDYVTMASVFPGYRCERCGHISRGRSTQVSLKKKQSFLVSTAK